jgi:hypothetical protein
MRGTDGTQESLFTVAKLEDFLPRDHPLRGRSPANHESTALESSSNIISAMTFRPISTAC